ncbi:helix-turn-helix domain-containing protein [Shewanella sp.]|uniref:helix-turn-helix domain-containing protein n=1 Tax=Shewanella sp. TaxID=50422 RepID=UPI003567CA6B
MDVILNNEEIRSLRTSKNWTQQHLAALCNVSLRTIQRVEKSGVTSIETLAALASVFEVSTDDLRKEPLTTEEKLQLEAMSSASVSRLKLRELIPLFLILCIVYAPAEIPERNTVIGAQISFYSLLLCWFYKEGIYSKTALHFITTVSIGLAVLWYFGL